MPDRSLGFEVLFSGLSRVTLERLSCLSHNSIYLGLCESQIAGPDVDGSNLNILKWTNECEEILRQLLTPVSVLASEHHTSVGVAGLFNPEDNVMVTSWTSSFAQLWKTLKST